MICHGIDFFPIFIQHLTELLLDPEKRMQWDKNVKLSTVLKVVDRFEYLSSPLQN